MKYIKRFIVGLVTLPFAAILAATLIALVLCAIPVIIAACPFIFVHDLGKNIIG